MLAIDLKDYLMAIPEISNVIGKRIYPGWFPEKVEYPAVAFLEVSGVSHHDIAVGYPRYQFSCFSPRYLEVKAVSSELRKNLQRYKGMMGSSRIIQIVWEGSREMYEPETKLHHIATDFKIIYWEE
ncbi:tail completion protein gp17 [Cohnella herbarum]|uniref:DUF3168 domain-containing protein n=1 Tax=Cohnella herbarum TaxID=2728023 RepID=A0A7Z2VS29_9BACL|nr:hypothetical protein [Cohnella herbarum]QJD87900.1 hypothetical protein HH215_35060 [Cohnella herbarum]